MGFAKTTGSHADGEWLSPAERRRAELAPDIAALYLAAFDSAGGAGFENVAALLSRCIMRWIDVSRCSKFYRQPWFRRALIALTRSVRCHSVHPQELDVPAAERARICAAFEGLLKALLWWRKKSNVDSFDIWGLKWSRRDPFCAALDRHVVMPLKGRSRAGRPGSAVEDLLFVRDEDLDVVRYEPVCLETLLDVICEVVDPWYWVPECFRGVMVRPILEAYAEECGLEELGESDYRAIATRWISGDRPGRARLAVAEQPLAEPLRAGRFEIRVDAENRFTTYRDTILGRQYVISDTTAARRTIDDFCMAPLAKGILEFAPEKLPWSAVKGQFMHTGTRMFARDQIFHEIKIGQMTGRPTQQYTGRWRVKTDEEIRCQLEHRPGLR